MNPFHFGERHDETMRLLMKFKKMIRRINDDVSFKME
jgi:hypothetical protein